jgi:hypothetical protein
VRRLFGPKMQRPPGSLLPGRQNRLVLFFLSS